MAFDDIAPQIAIVINGTDFGQAALEYVQSISVEMALDKCDLITLSVANPILDEVGAARSSALVFTDAMAFMPGQVVEVWMGFGESADTFVAAGIIRKYMPTFPQSGMPMITVKALDGGCLMMDGSDVINAGAARRFDEGMTLSDMAMMTVGDYGFGVGDMAFTDGEPAVVTIKKAGMSDYAFVRGLANMLGFEFYVDWDIDAGEWKAIWREPEIDDAINYTFTWGPDFASIGEGGILLNFTPEFAIQNAPTDVELYYFDRDTLVWEKIIYPEAEPDRGADKPSFAWAGDDTTADAELASCVDADTGRGLRVAAGGICVEVLPSQNFNSAEEALAWATAWWTARQNLLITGSGTVIGLPDLAPGQVHNLQGVGDGLSGDWYFAEVVHNFAEGAGYTCTFKARKVLP